MSKYSAEQGISGLILTGEFMSQPYHDSSREQYKEGFKDFLETIKLCEDKLKGHIISLIIKKQLRLLLIQARELS